MSVELTPRENRKFRKKPVYPQVNVESTAKAKAAAPLLEVRNLKLASRTGHWVKQDAI